MGTSTVVFSFRTTPEQGNIWRATAASMGMTLQEFCTNALEEYCNNHKLTADQETMNQIILERKSIYPLLIDRGNGTEKVYYPSEDDRQKAIDEFREKGVKVIMRTAVETAKEEVEEV